MKVEFYRHNIGKEEISDVNKVLASIFLTTGPATLKFEKKFAEYLNCKFVVGVSSCTAALFLSLKAYNIGPGDEVITTPMTFIATPNSIIQAGATPVFVDIEESTANIDANLIENAITKKTKAIMPVHLYGQMCDMKKIRKIADKYKLIVIEDAAHAIEAKRDGVRVGQLGDAACYSFYATKNITCGEGGAISTNNEKIADKLKKLRMHGMNKGAADRYTGKYVHWDMEIFGYKSNMDDIHAALLLNQLKKIDKFCEKREKISQLYEKAFKDNNNIKLLKIVQNSKSSRHLFTIQVAPEKRDEILHKLQNLNVGVAVNYRAVHLLKYYREKFRYKDDSFPIAEQIGNSTITLPLYPKLKKKEIDYIIQSTKKAVK